MGHDAKEQALVLMWTDVQTFEGYLGLQEALRNGHEAFAVAPSAVRCRTSRFRRLPNAANAGAEVYFNKLETRLGESEFIAGDRYTYADIVGFVYVGFAARALGGAPPVEGRPREGMGRESRRASRDRAHLLVGSFAMGAHRQGTIRGSSSCRATNGSTR